MKRLPGYPPDQSINGPNNQPEKLQSPESVETQIDLELDKILSAAQKSNEGSRGIILRLTQKDLSPELLQALKQKGVEFKDQTAAKVIKIYRPEEAENEFRMQKRAHELTNTANDPEMAKVPAPIMLRKFKISPETKENLAKQDVNFNNRDHVEVILMDWIPGEDLATKFYKKLLELYPDHPAQPHPEANFKELEYAVSIIAGFEQLKSGAKTLDERAHHEAMLYYKNFHKVYTLLRNKGVKVNPRLYARLKKTLKFWHANDLHHNDLHERNVEIQGEIFINDKHEDSDFELFILDFGTASGGKQQSRKYDDDHLLERMHKGLEQIEDPDLAYKLNFSEAEKLINNPNFKLYDQMLSAAKKDPQRALENYYAMLNGERIYQFMAMTNQLVKDNIITKNNVLEFLKITRQNKQKLTALASNSLEWYSRHIAE